MLDRSEIVVTRRLCWLEVTLTPYRYGQGGWVSYLSNLVGFLEIGQNITIRIPGFPRKLESEVVRSLLEILGLPGKTSLKQHLLGDLQSLDFVDTYVDYQENGHRPDLLVVLHRSS